MRVLFDKISAPKPRVEAQATAPGRTPLALAVESYAVPPHRDRWVRGVMVTTVDGAATGWDGLSGSINTAADHVVFTACRVLADAVVVGAGTVRAEGYSPLSLDGEAAELRRADERPEPLTLVVVSNSGRHLDRVIHGASVERPVMVVIPAASDARRLLQDRLGTAQVIVAGDTEVDLPDAFAQLAQRSLRRIAAEGGPSLLADLLSAGLIDELAVTLSPKVVGGLHPRIAHGPDLDVEFTPRLLLEHDGTLMGRWLRPADLG
ncbi:MAG: dihydrofolate reductase family protein [Actinomycetales bacterium]|nr:dihydrofolate reductase family protein [Actinomycetales bacterium]